MRDEIYTLFSVEKSKEPYSGSGFVAEECSVYDGALADYRIIVEESKIEPLKKWVTQNCRQAGRHVIGQLEKAQYSNAISLIKTISKIKTFTEHFVEQEGSVQGFLDHWGNTEQEISSEALEDRSIDTDASIEVLFKDEGVPEAEPVQGISEPINQGSVEDTIVFNFRDGDEDEEEEDNSDDLDFSSVLGDNDGEIEEPVVAPEPEPAGFTDPVAEQSESTPRFKVDITKKNEEEPVQPTQPVQSELEELPGQQEESAQPEFTDGTEEITEGIEMPFVKYQNGKAVVPLTKLVEFVNYVKNAAISLEEGEVPQNQILGENDKEEALRFLGQYSPAIFKEFVMWYVNSAETGLDFIRITKMLSQFCEFEKERSRKMREVSANE